MLLELPEIKNNKMRNKKGDYTVVENYGYTMCILYYSDVDGYNINILYIYIYVYEYVRLECVERTTRSFRQHTAEKK